MAARSCILLFAALQEMLGYEPVVVSGSYYHRLDEVLSPGCQGINLEVWNTETAKLPLASLGEAASAAHGKDLVEMKLGATGREAIYVPAYTSFVAGHYEGLQSNLPIMDDDGGMYRPLDLFPVDGTYGPEELTALGMTGPDFGCIPEDRDGLGWTKSTCTTGRWCVPTLPCQASPLTHRGHSCIDFCLKHQLLPWL